MIDYQRVVEDIQAAVASPDAADHDLVRDTAAEYAEACNEVNSRLAQCGKLLQEGLRSEAIQWAEREPALLGAVAILDFPQLPEWKTLLTGLRIVLPPGIQLNLASEINQAYAELQPLEALMKQHRLLALSRAPMELRIGILRAMAQTDPLNPMWLVDLRTFEQARMRQLTTESDRAFREGNLERLQYVYRELISQEWTSRPRQEVLNNVSNQLRQVSVSAARQQIPAVEKRLNEAYAAFDVQAGRACRDDWQRLIEVAEIPPGDPIMVRTAPALAWIAEQEAQESKVRAFLVAVHQLQEGLDRDAPRNEIDRLYHTAQRHEEPLPPLLAQQYRERIKTLDRISARRFRLVIVSAVGVLLILALLVISRYRRIHHEQAVASAVQALAHLIDDSRFAEARQFCEDQTARQPSIITRPEFQEQQARLHDLVSKEENRQSTFSQLIERVSNAGTESPDHFALNEADKLAMTPAEKARVAELHARISTAERQRQRDRDSEFQTRFTEMKARVEQLERDANEGTPPAESLYIQIQSELQQFSLNSPGVTLGLTSQIKPLELRVKAIRDQGIQLRRRRDSIDRITGAVGTPSTFRDALERHAKEFPESGESPDFRRVIEEQAIWDNVEQWRRFLSDRRIARLDSLGATEARDLVKLGKALIEATGNPEWGLGFSVQLPALQALAERVKPNGDPLIRDVERMLSAPYMAGLWYVKARDRDNESIELCYYLQRPLDISGLATNKPETIRIKHVVGFDLAEREVSLVSTRILGTGESPQRQLSKRIRPALGAVSDANWENAFLTMYREVRDEQELDPLLKVVLLRRIVSVGCLGSHVLAAKMQSVTAELDGGSVDISANWLLPQSKEADLSRMNARRLLERLPDASEIQTRLDENPVSRTRTLPALPMWVGWLHKDVRRGWQCVSAPGKMSDGVLLVATRATEGEYIWSQVGTVRDGSVVWDTDGESNRLSGRPTYLRPSKSDSVQPVVVEADSNK